MDPCVERARKTGSIDVPFHIMQGHPSWEDTLVMTCLRPASNDPDQWVADTPEHAVRSV